MKMLFYINNSYIMCWIKATIFEPFLVGQKKTLKRPCLGDIVKN